MNTQQTVMFDPCLNRQPPKNGNKTLIEWGIFQEKSDFRAHVGYPAQHAFIFPTKPAQSLAYAYRQRGIKEHDVKTRDIITAKGYVMPLSQIVGLQKVMIPRDIYQKYPIRRQESTSLSGKMAVYIVMEMIQRGLIALPFLVTDAKDRQTQIIEGADIILAMNLKIQVKADWRAGERTMSPECYGNIFLQTWECNPDKQV